MECLILFGVHFDMFFSIESLVVMAGLLQHRLTDASVCPGQVDAVQPPSSAFLPHCNLVSLPWQEVQHGCSAAQAEHAPQFTRWHPVLWSELWAGRQAGGSDWKKRRKGCFFSGICSRLLFRQGRVLASLDNCLLSVFFWQFHLKSL